MKWSFFLPTKPGLETILGKEVRYRLLNHQLIQKESEVLVKSHGVLIPQVGDPQKLAQVLTRFTRLADDVQMGMEISESVHTQGGLLSHLDAHFPGKDLLRHPPDLGRLPVKAFSVDSSLWSPYKIERAVKAWAAERALKFSSEGVLSNLPWFRQTGRTPGPLDPKLSVRLIHNQMSWYYSLTGQLWPRPWRFIPPECKPVEPSEKAAPRPGLNDLVGPDNPRIQPGWALQPIEDNRSASTKLWEAHFREGHEGYPASLQALVSQLQEKIRESGQEEVLVADVFGFRASLMTEFLISWLDLPWVVGSSLFPGDEVQWSSPEVKPKPFGVPPQKLVLMVSLPHQADLQVAHQYLERFAEYYQEDLKDRLQLKEVHTRFQPVDEGFQMEWGPIRLILHQASFREVLPYLPAGAFVATQLPTKILRGQGLSQASRKLYQEFGQLLGETSLKALVYSDSKAFRATSKLEWRILTTVMKDDAHKRVHIMEWTGQKNRAVL